MADFNENRFNSAPEIEIQRSKFRRNYNHKTTLNVGQLVPFYIEQTVLPGDTFKLNTNAIARLTTPLFPTMDNCFGDIYYFAVPYRLVFKNWKELNGENEDGAWAQDTEYEIPHYTVPSGSGGVKEGGWHDHAGVPTKVEGITFSQIPRRAYELIYNEWFRDQNVIAPVTIDKEAGDDQLTDEHDLIYKVSKLHDYFTSALPAPQKGDPVSLPLTGNAPVYPNDSLAEIIKNTPMRMRKVNGGAVSSNNTLLGLYAGDNPGVFAGANGVTGDITPVTPNNLYADLSEVTAATINELRLAFQTQRILEKDARGGTRYTEIIKQHFNVDSPDARQQRPEYLGSKRFTVNFEQIPQTSATDTTSPQGHMTAYSLTGIDCDEIVKSFTEHSIIMGLIVLRTQQTYQQGLQKPWSKRSRFEFYLPSFANIGEQPILKKELVATGGSGDNEVYGYQEAWAEYRMKPNEVTGKFRSNANGTLDSWHYAPNFTAQPVLSKNFLEQEVTEMDRTITVDSTNTDQLILDVLVEEELYRPLPLYSIPGLIDHF